MAFELKKFINREVNFNIMSIVLPDLYYHIKSKDGRYIRPPLHEVDDMAKKIQYMDKKQHGPELEVRVGAKNGRTVKLIDEPILFKIAILWEQGTFDSYEVNDEHQG